MSPDRPADVNRRRLRAVKAIHTAIWWSVETAVLYLLYAGLGKRPARHVGVAAALVAGESAIFLANGARCPLTQLAESIGDEKGSVTDIYLPGWLARNLPVIHVPLIALILYLHREKLRLVPGVGGDEKHYEGWESSRDDAPWRSSARESKHSAMSPTRSSTAR